MNKNVYPLLIVIVIAVIGFLIYKNVGSSTEQVVQNIDSSSTSITNEASKTDHQVDIEFAKEGIKDGTAILSGIRSEQQKKDSIRLANRSTFWAYKIGGSKSDPEDFKELYASLSNISNVYIFKVSRSEFFLIKYDGYSSEEQLLDKKADVENQLSQAGFSEGVDIKNLTESCELKDDVRLVGKEKIAHKVKIDCYTCN